MTATNHTLTGAIIGATLTNPVVAILAALLSHLVLDIVPHLGLDSIKSKKFNVILAVDILLASIALVTIFLIKPDNWLLILTCAAVAASPDLLSFPRWVSELKGQEHAKNWLTNFLGWIQWGERSWGWMIEVPFAIAAAALLGKLLLIW